jgi:hypothetical protein
LIHNFVTVVLSAVNSIRRPRPLVQEQVQGSPPSGLIIMTGKDPKAFMPSRERDHATLMTGGYKKNYLYRFFELQKALDQIVNQDSNALVGKQGKAVVAPNADAKLRAGHEGVSIP